MACGRLLQRHVAVAAFLVEAAEARDAAFECRSSVSERGRHVAEHAAATSARRYRTSRFSGTVASSAELACRLSAKRRCRTSSAMRPTSRSTAEGWFIGSGCGITSDDSTAFLIRCERAQLPAPRAARGRAAAAAAAAPCSASELVAERAPSTRGRSGRLRDDELVGADEHAGVRVAEVLAVQVHVPGILRDPDGGVVGRVSGILEPQSAGADAAGLRERRDSNRPA